MARPPGITDDEAKALTECAFGADEVFRLDEAGTLAHLCSVALEVVADTSPRPHRTEHFADYVARARADLDERLGEDDAERWGESSIRASAERLFAQGRPGFACLHHAMLEAVARVVSAHAGDLAFAGRSGGTVDLVAAASEASREWLARVFPRD